MESSIAFGVIEILEKLAEPIVKKITKVAKEEWEKFKVDFNIAFSDYLENAYEKYSQIKTLLYRIEPKYIYDFFEVPYLQKNENHRFLATDVDKITDISKFVLIQGTGGIGKSTLLKHLFLDQIRKNDLIPVFVELKNVNDFDSEISIFDLVFLRLTSLGCEVSKNCLDYALKTGCFLFLFDGYDEILSDLKNKFFKKLERFCDEYSSNYFIISSRPYSDFVEFQRFTILRTCPLEKEQALSLINKIDYQEDVKLRFLTALDEKLFEKHKSFASNPLLLNIMLMTYDNYADIPEKLHLFYSNAFETLYTKHDATKSGYSRELKCRLPYDEFRKVFSFFSYITYSQGRLEFTHDELVVAFNRVRTSLKEIVFDIDSYICDLTNSLCVLNKDGDRYWFSHRSFQEYFTAFFLKELPDSMIEKLALRLIENDGARALHDDVFILLFDMAEEKSKYYILLPMISIIEKDYDPKSDKFEFYLRLIADGIKLRPKGKHKELILSYSVKDYGFAQIAYRLSRINIKPTLENTNEFLKAEDSLKVYFNTPNPDFEVSRGVSVDNVFKDHKLYNIIKKTSLGYYIYNLINLKETLTVRQKQYENELANLALDL